MDAEKVESLEPGRIRNRALGPNVYCSTTSVPWAFREKLTALVESVASYSALLSSLPSCKLHLATRAAPFT